MIWIFNRLSDIRDSLSLSPNYSITTTVCENTFLLSDIIIIQKRPLFPIRDLFSEQLICRAFRAPLIDICIDCHLGIGSQMALKGSQPLTTALNDRQLALLRHLCRLLPNRLSFGIKFRHNSQ